MSNLVDFIPLLQYMPTPMHQRGKRLHQGLVNTYGGFVTEIKNKLDSGKHVPDCLSKTMLEVQDKEQLDHLDMSILASAFMIGGVETVSNHAQCLAFLADVAIDRCHHAMVFSFDSCLPRDSEKGPS